MHRNSKPEQLPGPLEMLILLLTLIGCVVGIVAVMQNAAAIDRLFE